MAKVERNTYKIEFDNEFGEVHIADEVVSIIAAYAATEVTGVVSMVGNVSSDIITKLGIKSLAKGVKVEILDGVASIAVAINIEYGSKILEVSKKVQDRVKTTIENMTGLDVADVNVRVASVEVK